MLKNLELKARIASLKRAQAVCRRVDAAYKGKLAQIDTYFRVRKGRLKLREINSKQFEIICYFRQNLKKSRYSNYLVVPVVDPKRTKELCSRLFGVRGVVRKNRFLYLFKNARIHIDAVKGLGTFIEFEVMVNQGKQQARQLMQFLTATFGIADDSIIAVSYVDLAVRKKTRT